MKCLLFPKKDQDLLIIYAWFVKFNTYSDKRRYQGNSARVCGRDNRFTHGQHHLLWTTTLQKCPFSTFKDSDKTSFTRITLFFFYVRLFSFHHKYYLCPLSESQQGSTLQDISYGEDRHIKHKSSSSSPFLNITMLVLKTHLILTGYTTVLYVDLLVYVTVFPDEQPLQLSGN